MAASISGPIPGFTGYVSVKADGQELYQQILASQGESDQFVLNYGQSARDGNWIQSSFVPFRTDNLNDLLCPIMTSVAKTTVHVAAKIFLMIFAFAMDVATLIPRLITAPFRACYIQANPEPLHPLNELIANNQHEQLKMTVHTEDTQIEDVSNNPLFLKKAMKTTIEKTLIVYTNAAGSERDPQETKSTTVIAHGLTIHGDWMQVGYAQDENY